MQSGVVACHRLHIWSTAETALTVHIVLDDMHHMEETKHLIRRVLEDAGIHHVTLGFECEDSTCDEETC